MKLVVAIFIALTFLSEGAAQNEDVTLFFDNTLDSGYLVQEEEGTLTICVRAEGTIVEDFDAMLIFFSAGATPGVDYSAPGVTTLSYSRTSSRTRCVAITIFQDGILENAGEFLLAGLSTADTSVVLDAAQVLISILDSDSVEIVPNNATYTTQEDDSVPVCISLIGSIAIPVSFDLVFSPVTASLSDYTPFLDSTTFEPSTEDVKCINISVPGDTRIEPMESFNISITSSNIRAIGGQATIFIEDTDGARVSLERNSSELSVVEGNAGLSNLSVCTQLTDIQSSLDRDVVLLFSTSEDTADESDYVPLSDEPLTIPAGSEVGENFCITFQVIGDEIRESNETLTINVEVENALDAIDGQAFVTIVIVDDMDDIADCGQLEDPENGNVTFPDTFEDSVATYSCSVGREISGSTTRTCEDSGEWSGDDPTCEFVDCGTPPSPPSDGMVAFTSTIYLSVAMYTCDIGYFIEGPEVRECQEDAMWSGLTPLCAIEDCGPPPAPLNGSVTLDTGTTTFGSTTTYQCDNGFFLNDTSTISCAATAQWSPVIPTCEPVECPELSNPSDGRVTVTERTFTNRATYECNAGFFLSGVTSRLCQANGTWSDTEPDCIVQCVNLDPPLNGNVMLSGTLVRDIAIYECNEGFTLETGNMMRTCSEDGEWTGQAATCEIVVCENLSAPNNGQIEIGLTTFQSTANYSCDLGYTLGGGEDIRTCGPDAEWTGTAPTCTIVQCEVLLEPEFGDLVLNPEGSRDFGTTARYSCIAGYTLIEGDDFRECQASGVWSGNGPSCEIVNCGNLTSPSNGEVSYTDGTTTFGSDVFYRCDEGHDLIGLGDIPTRECLASGEWSRSDPTCEPVDCGPLPDPLNGRVNDSVTTFGADAVYNCDEGHDLIGSDTRTCESTRDWSGSQPQCTPVDCGDLLDPLFGRVFFTTTTFGSNSTYACDAGYLLNGTATRSCQANRNWSEEEPSCEPVNCGTLPNPENGQVSFDATILGEVANYSCSTGYDLIGDAQRTCTTEGVWLENEPNCTIVDCGQNFQTPGNGTAMFTATTFMSAVMFSCDDGFTLLGQHSRTCLTTAVWSGESPTCERIMCMALPDPQNGVVNRERLQGSIFTATYECDPGFLNSDPDNVRVCNDLEDDTWSGEPSTCTIVNCSNPSIPENGQVDFENTVFESVALYECVEGYLLVPSEDTSRERRCTEDGSWFGPDPLCEPVNCGDLLDPENGEVLHDSTLLGSEANYSCFIGYEVMGGATRTCDADEMWSGVAPTCEDIDECVRADLNTCEDLCFNIPPGNFTCGCSPGFRLIHSVNCTDIDECLEGSATCSQLCNNTVGNFLCSCMEGYELAPDGFTCNDIDECVLEVDSCNDQLASCVNTDGSYSCSCLPGLTGSGIDITGNGTTGCQDIDECEVAESCDENASCNNTFGGFSCECLEGYSGNGDSCTNVDECQEGMNNCDPNAVCRDTLGSFTCTCGDLFVGNGVNCSEQCTTLVQLVLTGVVDCSPWRFDEAPEKLADIDNYIRDVITDNCQCNFPADRIFESEFSCPNSLAQEDVRYQTRVRGFDSNDCGDIIEYIETAIRSTSPTIRVLGNRLGIRSDCDVRTDSFGSELICVTTPMLPTTQPLVSQSLNIGVIAGGVVAGVVVLVLLVLIVLVLVIRKRRSGEMDVKVSSKERWEAPPTKELLDSAPKIRKPGEPFPPKQWHLANSFSPMTNISDKIQKNLTSDYIRTENSSYGRNLPLLQPNIPPAEQHIYATPTSYGIQPQAETSSFNPDADVLPRIGTLKKDNRYIDFKLNPRHSNPIPVSIPNPEQEKEEFYEKVSDVDSFEDVEELYDEPTKTDLEQTLLQAFDSKMSLNIPGSQEGSGNTSLSRVAEDLQTVETFVGKTRPPEDSSAEVAQNPLYDKGRTSVL